MNRSSRKWRARLGVESWSRGFSEAGRSNRAVSIKIFQLTEAAARGPLVFDKKPSASQSRELLELGRRERGEGTTGTCAVSAIAWPEHPTQLDAGQVRHVDVGQDRLSAASPPRTVLSAVRVSRAPHLKPARLARRREVEADLAVVDEQNLTAHRHLPPRISRHVDQKSFWGLTQKARNREAAYR